MDIDILKYREKDDIVINKFRTWPISLKKLINENYAIIKSYRKAEIQNYKLKEKYKRQNKYYDIYNIRNLFYEKYEVLKKKFKELLLQENKNLICFHSSRLTKGEIKRIKETGLKTSSMENLEERILNLKNDGLIDDNEYEILLNNNLLNKEKEQIATRAGQIWFTLGNVNIAYDRYSGLYNLYNNYGGEIIYFCIENTPLGEKLNANSFPSLVICKVKPSEIIEYALSFLIDTIFYKYVYNNANNIENEFYTAKQNIMVEDIVIVDENTKII